MTARLGLAARFEGMARVVLPAGTGACPPHPEAPHFPAPEGEAAAARIRCQRWTLLVVCVASALLLFNVTAPNVALPDIAANLGASFTDLQWVLSAYALVLASLLLAGGGLGDRYGRKRLFVSGLAGFALACLVCAVAGSPAMLVLGRVLQGLGAAAMFPSALALIAAEYSGAQRASAVGVWGASVAGAIALGPLVGGVLVDTIGWRAEFAFCVALAVPTLVLGVRHLRESRDVQSAGVDWVGTGLLTVGLFLLVFVLLRGNALGWGSPVVVAGALGGGAFLVAFLVAEHRVAHPIVAPELMRNRVFVGSSVVALLFAAAGFAPLVYISLFLLNVVDLSPTQSGLALLPFAIAAFALSLLAAPAARRFGTRTTLAAGLALNGVGLVLMHGVAAGDGALHLLPGLVVFGIGAGLVNPTMTVAALSSVPPSRSGMASGVNNTARQLGIAGGIAALGAVLEGRLEGGLRERLGDLGVAGDAARRAAALLADGDVGAAARAVGASARGRLPDVYEAAYTAALNEVFLLGVGLAALGVVLTLVLLRGDRPAQEQTEAEPEAAPSVADAPG